MSLRVPTKTGRGRQTAYAERDTVNKLLSAYFDDISQEELERKISSGTFSIWDRVRLTAMEGDTKILALLSSKIYPDTIQLPDGTELISVTVKRGS